MVGIAKEWGPEQAVTQTHQVVSLGHREAAKGYHPDAGGTKELVELPQAPEPLDAEGIPSEEDPESRAIPGGCAGHTQPVDFLKFPLTDSGNGQAEGRR